MRKALLTLVVLAVLGGAAYTYYRYRESGPKFTVATAAVTRGDVADTVGATGTLQAVTTVQVGTQVSGTIQSLYADFNSLVKKGQTLARLDPSLFQTQIEQARANLIRAQADVERLKVALDDARTKLTRAKELGGRQLLPQSELDAADVSVRAAEAQLRSAQAQVTQAQASLNQNEVNLQHTVINAPIDGLVISRNVDVGQTVAASMQAPTLFVLAADLTKMQVIANLDESDVGRIRPNQQASFRVDAYPSETFHGTVSQVRLQPIVQQNVVTYATVINVPNDELKLKPGMTANVNIEIARKSNVLRVPNAALRFRPSNEIFAALGQTPIEPRQRGDVATGAGRNSRVPSSIERPSAGASEKTATGSSEEGNATGRGGFAERMRAMTPEQRDRMRERGVDVRVAESIPGDRGHKKTGASAPATKLAEGATTIDALFGPLPLVETIGRVWLYADQQLKPVRLRVGISDGQATELIEGDIQEGMELVTNVTMRSETRSATSGATTNPFMGQQPGRGGFGGFPGGGNRGGGTGAGGR